MIFGIMVVFCFKIHLGGCCYLCRCLIILRHQISRWLIENALIRFLPSHFEGTKDLLLFPGTLV